MLRAGGRAEGGAGGGIVMMSAAAGSRVSVSSAAGFCAQAGVMMDTCGSHNTDNQTLHSTELWALTGDSERRIKFPNKSPKLCVKNGISQKFQMQNWSPDGIMFESNE